MGNEKSIYMNKAIATIIFIILGLTGFSQKTKNASGVGRVKVEENRTPEETKLIARNEAIFDAICSAYGLVAEQQSNLHISNGEVSFSSSATTITKAEWIETKSETFDSESIGGDLWIVCNIKGKVKEITTPKILIQTKTLGYPDAASDKTTFYDKEYMYLYFRSPVDGYISIYLEYDDMFYRLLPYSQEYLKHTYKVEADKEYFLFSQDDEHNYWGELVDKARLSTDEGHEINILHILFATEDFKKPMLNKSIELNDKSVIPNSVPYKYFQDWLTNQRAFTNDFVDEQIQIRIEKNK